MNPPNPNSDSNWDTTHLQANGISRMSFHADLPPSKDYPLFVELAVLHRSEEREEWREAARWVKYEEDIEQGGQRWSKPYVSSIHVSSLLELKQLLEDKGTVIFDLDCKDEEKVCRALVDAWSVGVGEGGRSKILQTLLRPHVHLYEASVPILPTLWKRKHSKEGVPPIVGVAGRNTLPLPPDGSSSSSGRRGSILSVVYQPPPQKKEEKRRNTHFLRKLPRNSECANVMVGSVEGLGTPMVAFIRLEEPAVLGNLTEVPLPTRFIFVLLSPPGVMNTFEIGRAISILLTDPGFKALAYQTTSKGKLIKGIGKFLESTSILPPAVWDSSIRLEPHADDHPSSSGDSHSAEEHMPVDDGLGRTGRLFGGLINDVKRKLPWYPSDIKDALSLQVLATWLFLYFACLTPMITFGGLMGEATHNKMGTIETILSGCVCGIVFAIFSGQPLLILGSTGPVLVFEKILVSFAESNNLEYLEFRLWVGLWVAAILLIFVATDASSLVRYITKFTEDNFATLIAIIFMFEAIKNVISIRHEKVELEPDELGDSWMNETSSYYSKLQSERESSIFLMSLLLFFSTFFLCYILKEFRVSPFFPTTIRYLVSDFAVILTIGVMTGIDYAAGVSTPKLNVPKEFAPTSESRGGSWFIRPFGVNPLWSVFAASVPALLATILIFMDQQITAVIVNRKDHKLLKGCGYHLDLFVLALLIALCSLFGLPWFVAATVESLTNLGSLKMESETAAPGEKPVFLGVREQRISNILVFGSVGVSVLLTPLLKNVPMPVLYGIFLYMGYSALMRMELFHRILLFFIPVKYQPDKAFLREVPLKRVHLFTLVQVLCLALLWTVKSIKATAIAFPLMLVVMMVVRRLLEFVFSQKELLSLDDALPGAAASAEQKVKNVSFNNNDKGQVPSVQIVVTES